MEGNVLRDFLTVIFPPGKIVECCPHSRGDSPIQGELNEDPGLPFFQIPS